MNSSHSEEVREVVTCSNSDISIGSSDEGPETKDKDSRRLCLIESFYDHFTGDGSDSSALNGVEIESALALLLLRCLFEVGKEKEKELQKEKEEAANVKAKGKKASKRSKTAKTPFTVSLVVPCGLSQQEAFLLYSAATRAAQFHGLVCQGLPGGCFAYSMRNLTNRAVCAVAGALSLQASVRSGLRLLQEEKPLVLFLRTDRNRRLEAGLVGCEGGPAAGATGNLLGQGRLHTLATTSHLGLGLGLQEAVEALLGPKGVGLASLQVTHTSPLHIL